MFTGFLLLRAIHLGGCRFLLFRLLFVYDLDRYKRLFSILQ